MPADLASPSSQTLLTEWAEPADVFGPIARELGAMLMESQSRGRYSYIYPSPFAVLTTQLGLTELKLRGGSPLQFGDPFEGLRQALREFGSRPFGVAAGYLGYELGTYVENVPASSPDDIEIPDAWIGFYDQAIIFDHVKRTILIPGTACQEMKTLILGACESSHAQPDVPAQTEAKSSFTRTEYLGAVNRVKEYISAGDVYQVNLSQRYSVPTAMHGWDVYSRLRARNPAEYAAFLNAGDFQVVSSSPETFLKYDPATRIAETRPIKGTRPRSADPKEDARLASELAASEKDLAENVMIVDLERNDLGKVCGFGSIRATELMAVESYPTVHHLVSTVTGRLREDMDSVDLISACFPGGSITGAPKIRAMEIINELEPVRRGVYTGSIGSVGFDGSVNLNIAIRTAIIKQGACHFHVGGGIVADSDPAAEYQETLDKGRAFFEVMECRS